MQMSTARGVPARNQAVKRDIASVFNWVSPVLKHANALAVRIVLRNCLLLSKRALDVKIIRPLLRVRRERDQTVLCPTLTMSTVQRLAAKLGRDRRLLKSDLKQTPLIITRLSNQLSSFIPS